MGKSMTLITFLAAVATATSASKCFEEGSKPHLSFCDGVAPYNMAFTEDVEAMVVLDAALEMEYELWRGSIYHPGHQRHLAETPARELGALRDTDCEFALKQSLCWAAFPACDEETGPGSFCSSHFLTKEEVSVNPELHSVSVCAPSENGTHKLCGPSPLGRFCVDLPQLCKSRQYTYFDTYAECDTAVVGETEEPHTCFNRVEEATATWERKAFEMVNPGSSSVTLWEETAKLHHSIDPLPYVVAPTGTVNLENAAAARRQEEQHRSFWVTMSLSGAIFFVAAVIGVVLQRRRRLEGFGVVATAESPGLIAPSTSLGAERRSSLIENDKFVTIDL